MAFNTDQLKQALYNAHQAGDTNAATMIATEIKALQQNDILSKWDQAQGVNTPEAIAAAQQQKPEPTMQERLVGAGEAASALITGATTGMAGGIGGAIKGAYDEIKSGEFGTNEAAQRIAQASMEGAQSGTHMPRTEQGKELLQGVEKATSFLGALPPIMAESAAISSAVRNATGYAPIAAAGIQRANQVSRSVATKAVGAAEKIGTKTETAPYVSQNQKQDVHFPMDGGGMSVGAAKKPMQKIRLDKAKGLMVPVKLTKGDSTRDEDQMKFEWETAKLEGGKPLREHKMENQQELQGNFDAMIDYIDAKITSDNPTLGKNIKQAIKDDFDLYTRRMTYAYRLAERRNAMTEPVEMDNLSSFMNANRDQRSDSGIMERLQKKLEIMEVSSGDFEDGTLSINKKMDVKQAEELIQYINKNVDQKDGRDRWVGGQLKGVIDEITSDVANGDYQKARQTRIDRAQRFEEKKLIADLLGTKRGFDDDKIAIEDVLKTSVLSPAAKMEGLKEFKKTLLTANEDGIQAWKDIQGSTLQYILDKATVKTTDGNSNAMISAAALKGVLAPLEKSGKLNILFSKKIQHNLELLKDVADYVLTAPPGVINSSNTASTLVMLADMLLISTGAVPAATITKFAMQKVKDRQLQKRILDALKDQNKPEK